VRGYLPLKVCGIASLNREGVMVRIEYKAAALIAGLLVVIVKGEPFPVAFIHKSQMAT